VVFIKKIALMLILLFFSFPANAAEVTADIIIDNTGPGFTADSKWVESNYASAYYGKNYAHDGDDAPNPDKWAMWTPSVALAGTYNIYIRWVSGGNRAKDAALEICHAGGTDYGKSADQTKNGGFWVYAGTYELSPGESNYVKIYANGSGYTTADAVKFEYVPDPGDNVIDKSVPRVNSVISDIEIDGQTDTAKEFPVYQKSVNKELGGSVRGFGMLAKFGAPGPEKVYFKRTTTPPAKPEGMLPLTLARVFAPNGNLAAAYEFTDQENSVLETVLEIPAYTDEGIWRISFSGGRNGDILEIGLPKTDIWGVRGEMALGITETTPEKAYIYAAQTTPVPEDRAHRNVLPSGFLGIEAYGTADLELFNSKGISEGKPAKSGSRNLLIIDKPEKDTVYTLTVSGGGSLVIDGVPGLLCPNRASAEYLKGGTAASGEFTFAGPLQARLYENMIRLKNEGIDVSLEYPEDIPEGIINPQNEVLLYGAYGPLSVTDAFLGFQDLDENSPRFGQVTRSATDLNKTNSTLAPAVTTPGLMNPAYGNMAIARRAALQSMGELMWMQGDDLLRTADVRTTSYPIEGLIFSYNTLMAEPLYLLRDYMDEETREIWGQAVTALTDKISDFKGYEPNQWSFVMLGHLHAYLATGEKRILSYFERSMNAYLDNSYGVNSKYGQHPAGYYLEEGGPDGNYDSLNVFHEGAAYNLYKDLPEASPELVAKMENANSKSLEFLKFFWLRQPDNKLYAPTAMNCRTDTSMSSQNYPGVYLLRDSYPLALRRFQMNMPGKPDYSDLGGSSTSSQITNTDEWAVKTLEAVLPKKGGYSAGTTDKGIWTDSLYRAYSKPITVEPAEIPTDFENGTWELPGLVAFKRGKLYGLVFYDVEGSTQALKGKFGGGPTVFWTEGTGNAVTSMRNSSGGTVSGENDVTNSCVFGAKADGTFFATGNEHPTLKWLEQDKKFELSSDLSAINGSLSWTYELSENETTVTVKLSAGEALESAYINIPIYFRGEYASGDKSVNGKYTYSVGGAKVTVSWDAGLKAVYADNLVVGGKAGKMDCVRLPIGNSPVTFKVISE
jgi:hypothetical protein